MPDGAMVVEGRRGHVLVRPGVVDASQPGLSASGTAAQAQLPGVTIVDLPPGAVAPEGMPEPGTLYRATAAPQNAVPGPAGPDR
jgi:hypothetical protein